MYLSVETMNLVTGSSAPFMQISCATGDWVIGGATDDPPPGWSLASQRIQVSNGRPSSVFIAMAGAPLASAFGNFNLYAICVNY